MAIYINKAGTKVDEAVVGTKTAEDWASQGFSAYNPTTPTAQPGTPAGSVAIPGGQIDQYNVLGQIGETGTPGSYLYGTKKAIDASSLGGEQAPIAIPEVTEGQDPSGMIAGATAGQKTLQDYINEISKTEKTETQTAQGGFLNQIAGLTKELEGAGADQLATEERLGIPTMTKDLADINAQITSKLAEYEDANIRIEGGEMARVGSSVVSQRRLSQKQSQLMREKASEIGLLQARALGIQGNIQAAQETANRAIDLKYSTIEAQINTYEAQLRAIQPLLNEEQQIRAEARQQMVNDQREAIAEKKEEEKLAFNLQVEGYTKISGPSQLAGLTEADILRLPNGDIYKKPAGEAEDRDTQVVTAGGRSLLIDKQTGETIADLGGAYKAGGGSATTPGVKLSTGDRGRLIAAGFNANEVSQIESDINEHGINTVIEGMSDEQAKVIKDVYSGVTPTQANKPEEAAFLNDEYVKTHWATEAAYNDSKKWWKLDKSFEDWQKDTLDAINANIKFYRDAGWTDKEIHKELLKNMQ